MAKNEYINGLEFVSVRLNHDRTLYGDTSIESASDAVKLIRSEMEGYDREHFAMLSLDAKGRAVNASIISIGELSRTLVHPREVFKAALLSNANSVIFFHNHPSGVPEPSREDDIITARLIAAAEILGIRCIDHIVIGDETYFSYCGSERLASLQESAEQFTSTLIQDAISGVKEEESSYSGDKEKKETFRDKVAAEFIKSLEEDPRDWVKKWASNDTGRPFNMATNRPYNGLNAVWLKFIEKNRGFSDPRWLTFNQVKKLNETRAEDNKIIIPKGTKMTQVEYFFMWDHLNKKTIPWEEYNRLSPEERSQRVDADGNLVTDPALMGTRIKDRFELRSRDHYVFNASQLENMPEFEFERVVNDIAPSEVVDRVAKGMGVTIREEEQDRAYYSPLVDRITLPLKSQFASDYDYQSTALHELGHATGNKSRLNRDQMHEFGSPEYAYEELIAEMTSCFMGEYVESPMSDSDLGNHIAYVQDWIEKIKNDKNYLFKAIKEAERAADYMIEKGNLEELKKVQSINLQKFFDEAKKTRYYFELRSFLTRALGADYKDETWGEYPYGDVISAAERLSREGTIVPEAKDVVVKIVTEMTSQNGKEEIAETNTLDPKILVSAIESYFDKEGVDFEITYPDDYYGDDPHGLILRLGWMPSSGEDRSEDFLIEGETEVGLISELKEQLIGRHQSFDVDEYVTEWLNAKSRGVQGVPGASELVDTAKEIASYYEDWSINVSEILSKYESGTLSLKAEVSRPELSTSVKEWFQENFPTDTLGEEIKPEVTFNDVNNLVFSEDGDNKDVYALLGVQDSLVRERIFEGLARAYGTGYDDIYKAWLGEPNYKVGEWTLTKEEWELYSQMIDDTDYIPEVQSDGTLILRDIYEDEKISSKEELIELIESVKNFRYPLSETPQEVEKAAEVFGYLYNADGTHNGKVSFEGTPFNIANFIMFNQAHDVVITDMVDQFLVSSVRGGWLDRVDSPELRDEIIKEILPLQMGEKEPIDVTKKELSAFSESITVEGHVGSWYVVAVDSRNGEPVFELEHEEFGDEAAHLIVDKYGNLIYDDIWNGFDDMNERDELNAASKEAVNALAPTLDTLPESVREVIYEELKGYWSPEDDRENYEKALDIVDDIALYLITDHEDPSHVITDELSDLTNIELAVSTDYIVDENGNEHPASVVLDLPEMEIIFTVDEKESRSKFVNLSEVSAYIVGTKWHDYMDEAKNYMESESAFDRFLKTVPEEKRETVSLVMEWMGEEYNDSDQDIIDSFSDMSNIGLAFSNDDETGDHEIQVGLNLKEHPEVSYAIDGEVLKTITFESYQGFNNFFNTMEFSTFMADGTDLIRDGVERRREEVVTRRGDTLTILSANIDWQEGSTYDGNYIYGQRFDSVASLEAALKRQDRIFNESGNRGYDKTGVTIKYITPDGFIHSYSDRYDVGDGEEFMNLKDRLVEHISYYEQGKPIEVTAEDDPFIETLKEIEGYQRYSEITKYLEGKGFIGNEPFNRTDHERYLIHWFEQKAEEEAWDGNFDNSPIIMLVATEGPLSYEGKLPEGLYYTARRKEIGYQFFKIDSDGFMEDTITVYDRHLGEAYLLGSMTKEEVLSRTEEAYQNALNYLKGNIKNLPEYQKYRDEMNSHFPDNEGFMGKLNTTELIDGLERGTDYNAIKNLTPAESHVLDHLIRDFREDFELDHKDWSERFTLSTPLLNRISGFYFMKDFDELKDEDISLLDSLKDEKYIDYIRDYANSLIEGDYAIIEAQKLEMQQLIGTEESIRVINRAYDIALKDETFKERMAEEEVITDVLSSIEGESDIKITQDDLLSYKIEDSLREINFELVAYDKASAHPEDGYLYIVTGFRDSDDSYATWLYNANIGSLNLGHYDFTSKEAAMLSFYERMDESIRPPYRITMYSGEYSNSAVKSMDSDAVIEDGDSEVSVLGYARTEEEGRAILEGMSTSVSPGEDSEYVVVRQIALELLEYDEDGDLMTKEVITKTDKPIEYDPKNRYLIVNRNREDYSATFYAPGDAKGLEIPFNGKAYMDGFSSFCEKELRENITFWKYSMERDPESAKETLSKMYSEEAVGALERELPSSLALTNQEREVVQNYFKGELSSAISCEALESMTEHIKKEEKTAEKEKASEKEEMYAPAAEKEKAKAVSKEKDDEDDL